MADHTAARHAALAASQEERTHGAKCLLDKASEARDHFTAGVYLDAARDLFGTGLMGTEHDDNWREMSRPARLRYHVLSDIYTAAVQGRPFCPMHGRGNVAPCPGVKCAALSTCPPLPPVMGCTGCGESFTTSEERESHTEACRGTAYIL